MKAVFDFLTWFLIELPARFIAWLMDLGPAGGEDK